MYIYIIYTLESTRALRARLILSSNILNRCSVPLLGKTERKQSLNSSNSDFHSSMPISFAPPDRACKNPRCVETFTPRAVMRTNRCRVETKVAVSQYVYNKQKTLQKRCPPAQLRNPAKAQQMSPLKPLLNCLQTQQPANGIVEAFA